MTTAFTITISKDQFGKVVTEDCPGDAFSVDDGTHGHPVGTLVITLSSVVTGAFLSGQWIAIVAKP